MKITKKVAQDMGCAYIYDDFGRINLKTDKVKDGAVLVAETLPTDGRLDFRFTPVVKGTKSQIFAFLRHCDLDFEGTEVGEIVDEMAGVAREFIMRLNGTGVYEAVESAEWTTVLDFLDANMAGVRVTLTLTDMAGECVSYE